MLNASDFLASCSEVLELVFGTAVRTARVLETCADEGEAVASIRFDGDICGRINLRLPKEQIGAVLGSINQKYCINNPVGADAVFPEMLNMFAANMSTRLSVQGFVLNIGTPENAAPAQQPSTCLCAQFEVEYGWRFTFEHLFEAERIPICLN